MNKLPVIGVGQARQLAGKSLRAGNRDFAFGNKESIRLGGQAVAIPLLDTSGRKVAFFRSSIALAATPAKIQRTSWLVGQRLHLKNDVFNAAPQLWFNSQVHGRPNGIEFDMAATIHGCAPGKSWKDWKEKVEFGEMDAPSVDQRINFSRSLIQRLATLEAFGCNGFLHGDLSDGNIMLDAAAGKVHLIDFDCFVFDSPTLSHPKLHVDAGGSKGTPSYMPPLLEAETSLHVGPVSDRFARDMLLIEILAFQGGDPIDTSPLYWSGQDELLADIANLAKSLQLEHLLDMSVFSLQESERPSSFDLASRIQLNVEDNTRLLLDSPLWLPHQKTPSSNNERAHSKRKTTGNALSSNELPFGLELPSWESAKGNLNRVTNDLLIGMREKVVVACQVALKAAAWFVLLATMFYMTMRCLFFVSFPANLVAAIVFLASTIWLGSTTGIWKFLKLTDDDDSV